jgi:mRNA interferase YafQ
VKFNPVVTNRFRKDYKLAVKRGYQITKLDNIMRLLLEGQALDNRHRDHSLTGNYSHRRECHIEPDWLLIYKLDNNDIIFERTGTHSDLFG